MLSVCDVESEDVMCKSFKGDFRFSLFLTFLYCDGLLTHRVSISFHKKICS